MLRSALQLRGYHVHATDGEIGKAKDFYFDDVHWGVRYLVIDTGTWLPGRRVLISPVSLGQPDWMKNAFPVALTRDEIMNSPGLDSDKPVSRQQESELVDYYNWPMYWTPAALPEGPFGGGQPVPGMRVGERENPVTAREQPEGDPHLRSMREVAGYHIQAQDGRIGHIEDFIVDDEDWRVRYLVIDTRNWIPGRRVILAPDWFVRFDWRESLAHTGLTKATIKDAPPYDQSQPVNRDYEGQLHDYYGRPAYWTEHATADLTWRI